MNADYTYDSETDQFVVTLDDGTEVCRTRAPHTQESKEVAQTIVDLLCQDRISLVGSQMIFRLVSRERTRKIQNLITFSETTPA